MHCPLQMCFNQFEIWKPTPIVCCVTYKTPVREATPTKTCSPKCSYFKLTVLILQFYQNHENKSTKIFLLSSTCRIWKIYKLNGKQLMFEKFMSSQYQDFVNFAQKIENKVCFLPHSDLKTSRKSLKISFSELCSIPLW